MYAENGKTDYVIENWQNLVKTKRKAITSNKAETEVTSKKTAPLLVDLKATEKKDFGKFYLEIPTYWNGLVEIKALDKTVVFYHKASHSKKNNGKLFTIKLYSDDSYLKLPKYKVGYADESGTYVFIYPTDVQFKTESQDEYRQLKEALNSIRESFSIKQSS